MTQNTIHISGGGNFTEKDSTIIKACVIFVKNYIQIKLIIYILICVTGG